MKQKYKKTTKIKNLRINPAKYLYYVNWVSNVLSSGDTLNISCNTYLNIFCNYEISVKN